jgi:hypothetical protein
MSDETRGAGAPPPPRPDRFAALRAQARAWWTRARASRVPGLAAAAIVIAAFGGGYLTAQGLAPHGGPAAMGG